MRCLTYALRKWHKEGGYLCVMKSKHLRVPHFLHSTSLGECTHMTASIPPQPLWKEIWYVITGQHYAIKKGDD